MSFFLLKKCRQLVCKKNIPFFKRCANSLAYLPITLMLKTVLFIKSSKSSFMNDMPTPDYK